MEIKNWIDNSKIGCLERCPREFYLRYGLHLTREVPSSAIAFGKAMHEVIENALKEHDNIKDIVEYCEAVWEQTLMKYIVEIGIEVDYEDYRLEPSTGLLALSELFMNGAGKDLLGLKDEVLNTEMELSFKVLQNFEFRGKADIVLRTKAGTNMLVDIKTTGWKMESWAEKATVDCQLHSYALALDKMNLKVHSGAYLVVQTNRRRLSSGAWSNKPTLKSALFPIAVTEDYKERMLRRIERAVIKITGRAKMYLFEPVWSQCQRLSGVCQFHPLCERYWRYNGIDLQSIEPELLEVALSLGYRQEEWNPFDY